ncbi:MAG: ATP-binding protein [Acidimicrobiia bacterium]|nr:ATP-binding protein [Acidimicrobiia bacterium]
MELRLAADAQAPRVARQRLSQVLHGCDADTRQSAELLISELVTNAVRHGPSLGEIDVRVVAWEETMEIAVSDVGRGFDPVEPPPTDGYGLEIIETLSSDWGVVDNEHEFRVWCRVDTPNCTDTTTSS